MSVQDRIKTAELIYFYDDFTYLDKNTEGNH